MFLKMKPLVQVINIDRVIKQGKHNICDVV